MKEGKAYEKLKIGEIVVADIIGEGFYRIHSFGECFVNVECLKLFGKGFLHRGHITNCHNTPQPIDLKKWLSYRRVSLNSKNKNIMGRRFDMNELLSTYKITKR